jgi:hypothetical protein
MTHDDLIIKEELPVIGSYTLSFPLGHLSWRWCPAELVSAQQSMCVLSRAYDLLRPLLTADL